MLMNVSTLGNVSIMLVAQQLPPSWAPGKVSSVLFRSLEVSKHSVPTKHTTINPVLTFSHTHPHPSPLAT